MEHLWHLVSQAELTLKRGGESQEVLPKKPLDAEELKPAGRQHIQGEIPLEALKSAVTTLVDHWGVRPAQARGTVTLATRLYTWCCPRVEELGPGQLV